MEPETDDNLITWGWVDHLLQVTPESVDEVLASFLGDRDPAAIPEEQMTRMREAAQRRFDRRQRVPMIRVMTHQSLPVLRVVPFNEYQRNRFYRP